MTTIRSSPSSRQPNTTRISRGFPLAGALGLRMSSVVYLTPEGLLGSERLRTGYYCLNSGACLIYMPCCLLCRTHNTTVCDSKQRQFDHVTLWSLSRRWNADTPRSPESLLQVARKRKVSLNDAILRYKWQSAAARGYDEQCTAIVVAAIGLAQMSKQARDTLVKVKPDDRKSIGRIGVLS